MPGNVHLKASDPGVQKDLNRYYEKCMADGKNRKEYCARVAWNILCANKSPDYPGCTEFGKSWGPPYSSPKGEEKTCPCNRKFGFLMASIQEEKNVNVDGAVRRDEFDIYPPTTEVTPEARRSAEEFIVYNTPSCLKFQNAKSENVIAYGDRRGRSVVVSIAEMADDEVVWLAKQKGWEFNPTEPEVSPNPFESLRQEVSNIMEGKTSEGFEGIGNKFTVKTKNGTDVFRVQHDGEDWDWEKPIRLLPKTEVKSGVSVSTEFNKKNIDIGQVFYAPESKVGPYYTVMDIEVQYRGAEDGVQREWYGTKTAKDALELLCSEASEWLDESWNRYQDPAAFESRKRI